MTKSGTLTAAGFMLVVISACGLTGAAYSGDDATSQSLLADTSWVVDQLGDQSGSAIRSLTLTFGGGGRINGHDGCNVFSGDVQVSDTTIRVGGKLIGTMMACPDDVEARARAYRSALLEAVRYRMQDGKLEMIDRAGQVLIVLAPALTTLGGTDWILISYNNGKQAVVGLIAGTKITARFGEDGRITGHAGCNGYFASYKVTGQRMAIGPPASTRKACAEPAGVMEQETLYLLALASAAEYRISGDRLELRNARGSLVGGFIREKR
jgi:heat shock protein HslJ